MASPLDELKRELAITLEKDPNNLNKIIDLSSQLSQYDTESIRFSVDAGVINRLGKELVSKPETAVSELAKNAYDADATEVILIFKDVHSPGGTLVVEDNGVGMTRHQLVNGFMRISSTEKIHFPVSTKYKRRRAGRKGIGRFATQRLGEKLTIVTQTSDSNYALKILIDWSKFEVDKNLSSVVHKIEEIEKSKTSGTTLLIEGLRDAWPDTSLKRAYRYLADLLQPFPLSEDNKRYAQKRKKTDPGFSALIKKQVGNDLVVVADEQSMFLNYATAVIEGYIDSDGIGICSIDSPTNDIDNELYEVRKNVEVIDNNVVAKKEMPYDTLQDVHFKCFYFIHSLLPKQESSAIRKNLREFGGLKLYRNGFRVPTIGEMKDDWLGLDISVRRRSILPPHGNNNFSGFVEVTDIAGDHFDETSNRENLTENESFTDLKDFIYRAIIKGVMRISEARGTKDKTNSSDYKTPGEKLEVAFVSIDNIAEEFRQKGNVVIAHSVRSIVSEMREALAMQREIDLNVLSELSMLRVLSSLGLTIGEFTHEIKNYIRAIIDDSDYFLEKAKFKSPDYAVASRLKSNIVSFSSYAAYFDETVSQNANRTVRPLALEVELSQFIELIKPALIRSNIKIMGPEISEYGLYTIPMHPSEFKSILFNFFTNARKAILKSNNQGKILIVGGSNEGKIHFDFMDNGVGVEDEIKDRIFDAFFTTSSPVGHLESEAKELTGSGLGLKIVKDIITSYGGSVSLADVIEDYRTCFRIEVPQATEKILKDYGVEY